MLMIQFALTLLPAGVLVVLAAVLWVSVHRVPEETVEIVVSAGEEQRVLGPGAHVLSPTGIQTYRIDPEAMVYEAPSGSLPVPNELRDEVSRVVNEEL